MDYILKFPFRALHFDFSNTGEGVAEIIDRYDTKARLCLEVSYPFSHDPTPGNLTITEAWLVKNRRRYKITARNIRIEG